MSGPQLPQIDGSQTLGSIRHQLFHAVLAAHIAAYREVEHSRAPSEQLRCAEAVLRVMAKWAASRL